MEDTIAAVATAIGEGGIGIVRISGGRAREILQKVFKPAGWGGDFDKALRNRRFSYGFVLDRQSGKIIDEAMAVFMAAPKTYTMEDVAEIHCHGSLISLQKTLTLVLAHGARPAQRGEFTKRAFLNGRLDLSQAEAITDLVRAKTEKGYHAAVSQMEGELSGEVKKIRAALMDVLVEVTVNLDYPDEDIEELTYGKLIDNLLAISDLLQNLGNTTGRGKILREGLQVVIIGKPNVGKSTLMNALLREQRAIVTDIPGTTRDTIEEIVDIKGIPVKLIDTAGIRQTEDKVESIGVEKAKKSFQEADLVICIVDAAEELSDEDREILSFLEPEKSILLLNKTDLGAIVPVHQIKEEFPGIRIIESALIKGKGVPELEEVIYEMVYGGVVSGSHDVLITNVRHADLIEKSVLAIYDSIAAAKMGEALDFIEVDVKRAYELLGEIIGETVSDDIIDEVFARFCLGK